jgi:hypothetical protein
MLPGGGHGKSEYLLLLRPRCARCPAAGTGAAAHGDTVEQQAAGTTIDGHGVPANQIGGGTQATAAGSCRSRGTWGDESEEPPEHCYCQSRT